MRTGPKPRFFSRSASAQHHEPCNDLKGYKATLQYAESTDKTVDGQVFAIELHK